MKKTILTLAGIIALGTTTLVADGSVIVVNDNVMAVAVADVDLHNATIGLDVQTNNSAVSASGNTMAISVASTTVEEATVGVAIDDKD